MVQFRYVAALSISLVVLFSPFAYAQNELAKFTETVRRLRDDSDFGYVALIEESENVNRGMLTAMETSMLQKVGDKPAPNSLKKQTTSISSKTNTFIHAQRGRKFIQQDVSPTTFAPIGPAWYYDGQKTHILTGVALRFGDIDQTMAKVDDNFTRREDITHPSPSLAISAPRQILFLPNFPSLFSYSSSSNSNESVFTTPKLDYFTGCEYYFVKGDSSAPTKTLSKSGPHNNWYILADFKKIKGYSIPQTYTYRCITNSQILCDNQFRVKRLSTDSTASLFEKINRLPIKNVFDQNALKGYKLNDTLGSQDKTFGSRMIFGWVLVISLSTLLFVLFRQIVAKRTRQTHEG